MPSTTRKLEVFSIAARSPSGVADYRALFSDLASMRARDRILETGERLVALRLVKIQRSVVVLRVIEGPIGIKPLIFGAATARERIEDLAADEIVATSTHAAINLTSRDVVVEFNHRGAKWTDVAAVLQETARKLDSWTALELTLTPVAQSSFFDAVNRFRRVRVASVKLVRPNYDWTDSVNAVNELAAATHGATIEITVNAGRKESLSKTDGLMEIVRRLTRQARSQISAATVTGTRESDDAETSVSLRKFIEHKRVRVDLTEDGHVRDEHIDVLMLELLKERAAARS